MKWTSVRRNDQIILRQLLFPESNVFRISSSRSAHNKHMHTYTSVSYDARQHPRVRLSTWIPREIASLERPSSLIVLSAYPVVTRKCSVPSTFPHHDNYANNAARVTHVVSSKTLFKRYCPPHGSFVITFEKSLVGKPFLGKQRAQRGKKRWELAARKHFQRISRYREIL